MPSRTIEQLNGIEDIKQLKARYCRLIDQKQWNELEADFVADATIEIAGAPGGADDTQRFSSAHAFIEGLRQLMGPLVSVHQVHAPEIEILNADTAQGTWTISDRLVFPDGNPLKILQGWGIYHETYKKVSGSWRFASVRLERLLVEPEKSTVPDNAKTVATRLLQCIGSKDLEGMKDLFAEEIDWFVPGSSELPWTGKRTKGSQAPEFFAVMWPYYVEGKSAANVDDIVSDGNNVVITGTFSHVIAGNGRSFETPIALHLKVHDGKISYLQLYEDTLLISQAFGADGAPAVALGDLPRSLKPAEKSNTGTYRKAAPGPSSEEISL
ncbi:nuclear transport factor 2 family protein [Neorhizobium sp. BETTINA12A]|uniref:nuclear transport factor 2 family protein n=1 Tax=Neorhizobium sp. BETTINA12A TaxID=2908924 RepID=UPI001FF53AEB|nr:nuclear transport factor 2 family protein [Neorhizobium sp. BETTINA12A]MCJ9751062.1 nuclear transport factor 2 family protein [Neorhizobium sp. BETTINA12A]